MKVLPLNIDTQIEDCLFGKSDQAKTDRDNKLWFVASNIKKIFKVNGSKVYDVRLQGEDIYYNLKPMPEYLREYDKGTRKYYYPIEYANIEFKD